MELGNSIHYCGTPPYGYTYVRKTVTTPQHLVINEVEAEIVRQIYRWCMEEQLSAYAIQRRLTLQGIPPRKATRGWAQSSVIEILRDPIYTGDAYDNRTQQSDTRRPYKHHGCKDRRPGNGQGRTRRPPHEWIPVRVPALIDPESWERVQAQLARNRERARRHNTHHRYLLRSLLVCGRCGQRMTGTWNQYGGRYICAARYPRSAPGACTGRSLSATRMSHGSGNMCSGSGPTLPCYGCSMSKGGATLRWMSKRNRNGGAWSGSSPPSTGKSVG